MNTSKQPEEDETVLTDENATKSTPPPTPPGNSSLFFWPFQQEFLENQEKLFLPASNTYNQYYLTVFPSCLFENLIFT